jgi:hypothetical protein
MHFLLQFLNSIRKLLLLGYLLILKKSNKTEEFYREYTNFNGTYFLGINSKAMFYRKENKTLEHVQSHSRISVDEIYPRIFLNIRFSNLLLRFY